MVRKGQGKTKTFGSKTSKIVQFEKIDFSLFADQDKTVSFNTDNDSLPLWIRSTNDYYHGLVNNNYTVDIIWTLVKSQRKLFAQVRACKFNQDGATHDVQLSISFYYSTFRILLQGNGCRKWSTDVFPHILNTVQSRRDNGEKEDFDDIISTLIQAQARSETVTNEAEPASCQQPVEKANSISTSSQPCKPSQTSNGEQVELPSEQLKVPVSPERLYSSVVSNSPLPHTASNASKVTHILTESPPNISRTPKRLLPATPNTVRNLIVTVEKLETDNINLKEKLHDLSIQNVALNNEVSQQKKLISSLQQNISEIKGNTGSDKYYKSLSSRMDIIEKETHKEFSQLRDKCREMMSRETTEMFARLRDLEQLTHENKTSASEVNDWKALCLGKFDQLEHKLNDLLKDMNVLQQDVFDRNDANKNKCHPQLNLDSDATLSDVDDETIMNSEREVVKPDADGTWNTDRHIKQYKTMTGKGIIFGDSNTKGLIANKLKMRIGSISGATLDSAIDYLNSTKEEKDSVAEVIVFHLGSNNLLDDDIVTLKEKVDKLLLLADEKYVSAKIGICKIPHRKQVSSQKVNDLNTYIKATAKHYIDNNISEINFTRDNLHYNKKGLAILAKSVKDWARIQEYSRYKMANNYNFGKQDYVSDYHSRGYTNDYKSNHYRFNPRYDYSPRKQVYQQKAHVYEYNHGKEYNHGITRVPWIHNNGYYDSYESRLNKMYPKDDNRYLDYQQQSRSHDSYDQNYRYL